MKSINPMYIALLLIAALLVTAIKLHQAKQEQHEALESLKRTEATAQRITALKERWDTPRQRESELERLLRSGALRNAGIVREKRNNTIILDAEEIDRKSAEYLLNKLFNGSYTIKTLRLKRLDASQANLHLEVTL